MSARASIALRSIALRSVAPFARSRPVWLAVALLFGAASTADAYVGPGAGFALLSSFFVVLATIVIAILSLLAWPFRAAWRLVRGGRRATPLIRRLIIIGFDGQEPSLTDAWMKDGMLPNFKRLAAMGCYHRLRTTFPSISPVAWSSFSTGTNPARHNIFDFLDRDRRTYLPRLSSTKIESADRAGRVLKVGPFRIPLRRPHLELLRRSKPFWTLLGERRIWSTVLRVPITFPPDRFYGAELSAMAVPDLLGTQGTFFLYTTRPAAARFKEGGTRVTLTFNGDVAETTLTGPDNTFLDGTPPMTLPMRVTVNRSARTARVEIGGRGGRRTGAVRIDLAAGTLTDWVAVTFRAAPLVTVSGLCRMLLTEIDAAHVSIYITPISIDPEHPAMPISHPSYYATYLAKKIGPYATLGLAEDTWALNEGAIDDDTFVKLTHDIDDERQRMLFAALDRLREGSLTCVFDATDRIQHMFWRHVDRKSNPIRDLYRRNDALLGRILDEVREDDVLMVISDHGFSAFRRGVNVNRWLLDHGFLALKDGADGSAEWLRDVDWSRTKAYALGLTGVFLNLQGREAQGIVAPGDEARAVKSALMAGLGGLRDEEKRAIGIRELFDTAVIYDGPYAENAPDLIVGYNAGYRVSWDCATGVVAGPVFEDNVKAWSGDHGIDPRLVPGVFFCNRVIDTTDPALIDIAPTALRLFGLEPPPHMDGKPLFRDGTAGARRASEDTAVPAKPARTPKRKRS